MPIMLNTILNETGINLEEIRLIRHKDNRANKGYTPYELWRDNREKFEDYQSTQSISNRKKLNVPYWAVFIANLSNETMFAGLYSVSYRGLLEEDSPMPHMDGIDKAGSCDVYNLKLLDNLNDLIGKMIIDWGPGALAWVQHATKNNKPIIEVRKSFKEPKFPGYLNFIQPLSKLNNIPSSWKMALESSRGIYLLVCPKTKRQYIGSASSVGGFWGRWQDYINTGDGGNVGLKGIDTSNYLVSILEVAGSSASHEDILLMEGLWQTKLQSNQIGLNKNLAKKTNDQY